MTDLPPETLFYGAIGLGLCPVAIPTASGFAVGAMRSISPENARRMVSGSLHERTRCYVALCAEAHARLVRG